MQKDKGHTKLVYTKSKGTVKLPAKKVTLLHKWAPPYLQLLAKSKKVIHVSNQVIPRSTPLKILSSCALNFKMADKSLANDWPCYLFY